MNPQTGEMFSAKEIEEYQKQLENDVDGKLEGLKADMENLQPVKRDLTEREIADKQILLYSPCACGSGKKFKFCCFKRP